MPDPFSPAPGADGTPAPGGRDSAEDAPTQSAEVLLFRRYRVIRELGRGGMGVVQLAHDTALDIPVAVKLVPDLVVKDTEAIADLRKEVLRGMALAHPGIVRTHNFERDESGAGIVMEYVEGETLTDLKTRQPGGCFDPPQILPWLVQLCAVLDYAHREARLVHRDLKPRNIMLTRTGKVKVADFGIAALLSDSMSRHSMEGRVSGTLCYMSPQQAEGKRPSPLDDIHALGATIYELLTGKPPFFRGSPASIHAQILSVVPPSMAERRADLEIADKAALPPAWEKVIAACLAKEPAQRPQSAGEVLARLQGAAVAEQDTLPLPPPARPSSRAPLAWGALAVLTLAAGGAYYFKTAPSPETTAPIPLATPAPAPALPSSTPAPTPLPAPATPTPPPATPFPTTPPPTTPAPPNPATATKDAPFVNSLGMVFVPVPQTRVLACVWETRVQDFAAFADATSYDATSHVFSLRKGAWETHGDSWRSPGFAQTGAHPVCGVNWFDAVAFCEWLTARERALGRLRAGNYRLPTDAEWSAAAGRATYPWGEQWPPAADDANVAGGEANDPDNAAKWEVIANRVDPYPRTGPVGRGAPNALGLFDLGGNVWEWCADPLPGKADSRVIRGGSWFSFERAYLRTDYRGDGRADSRGTVRGFRIVLALPPGDVP